MTLCSVSAYCGMLKPFLRTPSEKPKLGRDGATTWNDGPSGASVRSGRILATSAKWPGPEGGVSWPFDGLARVVDADETGRTYIRGRRGAGCCPASGSACAQSERGGFRSRLRVWSS